MPGGAGAATGALDVAGATAPPGEGSEPKVDGIDGPQAANVPAATRLTMTVRSLMTVLIPRIGHRRHGTLTSTGASTSSNSPPLAAPSPRRFLLRRRRQNLRHRRGLVLSGPKQRDFGGDGHTDLMFYEGRSDPI